MNHTLSSFKNHHHLNFHKSRMTTKKNVNNINRKCSDKYTDRLVKTHPGSGRAT